jgi:pyruvate/2-oxoglutarate dehydrogenase complex dihydrolipoamide acyltransferase (E2) component
MRPVRPIAALLLAAGAALLTVSAAPASAASTGTAGAVQARPTLRVSPRSVTAGDTVTVSGWLPPAPGSECATGITLLSRAFVHTDDFAGVPAVHAAVKPDGTFSATTRIPRSRAAGTYTISGRCGGGNIGASATLVVRAAAAPTTTPAQAPSATAPPVTQPAQPAPQPQATAPTGATPATPATDRLADRWVIPGLVALAAGALAAVAVWLLSRRHHPASLGR